jgi:hypothetical protein
MRRHIDTVSPNLVGITRALAYREAPPSVSREEFQQIQERQATVYRLQLGTVFLAALAAVALAVRRLDDVQATVLAIPLLLTGLNLASYYYALLVLLVLAHAGRPLRLAAVFGLELLTYAILLFEERDHLVYIYRSLLLLWLLSALYMQLVRSSRVQERTANDAAS